MLISEHLVSVIEAVGQQSKGSVNLSNLQKAQPKIAPKKPAAKPKKREEQPRPLLLLIPVFLGF